MMVAGIAGACFGLAGMGREPQAAGRTPRTMASSPACPSATAGGREQAVRPQGTSQGTRGRPSAKGGDLVKGGKH
jgi:hypothetical protein